MTLDEALAADDAAEDNGMHPDDRITCFTCRRFIGPTHRHDLTGRLISA